MDFAFPSDKPTYEITIITIAIHVGLLVAAILPIALLFFQSKRPVEKSDAFAFLLSLIIAPFFFGAFLATADEYSQPFIAGYLVFFEIVSFCALVITIFRLRNDGKGMMVSSILGTLFACGILIALFLPAVPSAREAARRTQCASNLKQHGLALLIFHDIEKSFPCPLGPPEKEHAISWRVSILPYMEHQSLYSRYDRGAAWDSIENKNMGKESIASMICPSSGMPKDENGNYFSTFSIPLGKGTFFGEGRSVRTLKDATAGTSNTILSVEASGQNLVWSQPKDVNIDVVPIGINLPGHAEGWSAGLMSSHHPQMAHALLMDGSVQAFSENDTDAEVLRQLLSGKAKPE